MHCFPNGCILDKDQYMYIYRVSFLSVLTAMCGFAKGKNDIALVSLCGSLTSINYWRFPNYSWRRNTDMTVIILGVLYNFLRAYRCQYIMLYYLAGIISVSCYPASWYYYNKKKYWTSTYLHCMVHVFGNATFYILYSSDIVPIHDNPLLNWLPLQLTPS